MGQTKNMKNDFKSGNGNDKKKYCLLNVIILCHVSCILLKILNFCKNFCCPKILIMIIFGQNSSQNLLKLPLSLRFFVTTSFVAIRHHQKKTSIIIIIEHYFFTIKTLSRKDFS